MYICFRFKVRTSSTTSTSSVITPPVNNVEIQSPEADTSAPPPPPIVIHVYKTCQSGTLFDAAELPSTIEDISVTALAKKLVTEILRASSKTETILARLGALRGDEMVISHGGSTYTIKLPTLHKTNDLETVFTTISSSLGCCQHMFSKYSAILTFIFNINDYLLRS